MATDAVYKPGYVGETKNLLREGHGVYIYENQYFRYEGTWKNGKKHGHGKLLMQDGTFYEGQFINGEITGHGYKFFAATKARYTGQFLNGELEGYGIMHYDDGTQYEGEWHQNRKTGMGVMKLAEGTYKGCFQAHRRNGQGSLAYENVYKTLRNGDYYKGYWVMDKRQGHGRLVCADGTVYEGQWYNDLFHGDGFMEHASGILYSGQWVNGLPVRMAAKIVITNETSEIDIKQGETFSISVEVRDGADELVEDQGRELQITAGFKYYAPVGVGDSALFDMIEDMEEKPISTPFGYDIVPYPLTDQPLEEEKPFKLEEESKSSERGDSEEKSEVTSKSQQESSESKKSEQVKSEQVQSESTKEEHPTDSMDGKKEDAAKKEEEKKEVEKLSESGRNESPALSEAEGVSTNVKAPVVSKPLPPPVSNKRTGNGKCSWESLRLAPPPPMYRPFLVMEQVEKSRNKIKKDKSFSKQDLKDGLKESTSEILTDETHARTGEYVIMVTDVTDPPFLNHILQPAFMLVKLRKLIVKKPPVKKTLKQK